MVFWRPVDTVEYCRCRNHCLWYVVPWTLSDIRTEVPWAGIGLFTFHKYRKSLESNVPLDAHGNPVTGEDNDVDYTGEASGRVVTEEGVRLTSGVDIQDEFGEVRS